MTSVVCEQWPKFQVLAAFPLRRDVAFRQILLKRFSADPAFCKALRIVTKNVLRRNVLVTSQACCRLRKHKRALLNVYKKRMSAPQRRKVTVQSGGFLSVVIPLVASIVGELIRSQQ